MWVTLLILGVFIVCVKKWRETTIKGIPGPKFALPIVGHLPFVSEEPHKKFLEWKKIYGPIFSVQMGNLRTLVLNDLQLIREAYSMHETMGRPPQAVFQRACDKKGMVFASGPGVFEQRKFFLKNLRKFCYEDRGHFESVIQEEISHVLSKFGENHSTPFKMHHCFSIPSLNSVWSFFMGDRFDHSDPKVNYLAECAADFMTIEGLMANLGFFVPAVSTLLPNITGSAKMYNGGVGLYEFVDHEWKKGTPSRTPGEPRNYKEAWMDKSESSSPESSFHPSHNYFSATMGDILLASIETTAATIDWAVIYLARNPEYQRKLQEDLDSVVGVTGLITLEDRPQLPFVEAIIHEVLRISSLGVFGLLHCTTADWNFHGFKIPEKTCVIGNLYAVHHDPETWENPEVFRPERFLDAGNNLVNTNLIIPFSTGKRYCIGENVARDQLFLFISNIFYKFNVSCTEKLPDLNPIPGVTSTPRPYEVVFCRRHN